MNFNVFLANYIATANNLFVKLAAIAVVMDTALGALRAAKYRRWNSSVGIDGGIRKVAMVLSILFMVAVDMLLHVDVLSFGFVSEEVRQTLAAANVTNLGIAEFFCFMYILYECTSILKNALLCGVPCPKGLQKKLAEWLAQFTEETKEDVVAAVGEKVKTHIATSMLEEMETDELESLALEMGMTVKDGTNRDDLIKAIAAVEVYVDLKSCTSVAPA